MVQSPPPDSPLPVEVNLDLYKFVISRVREEYKRYAKPIFRLDPHAFQAVTFNFGPEGVMVTDINDHDVTEEFLEKLPKGPRDEVRVRDTIMKRRLADHALLTGDERILRLLGYTWKDHPDYNAKDWRP
jgi:hypothetical protein